MQQCITWLTSFKRWWQAACSMELCCLWFLYCDSRGMNENSPDQGPKRPVSTKMAQTKQAHSIYKNGLNWCLKRLAKTALESNTFQQISLYGQRSRPSPSSWLIVSATDFLAPLCDMTPWLHQSLGRAAPPCSGGPPARHGHAGGVSPVDRNSGGKRVVDAVFGRHRLTLGRPTSHSEPLSAAYDQTAAAFDGQWSCVSCSALFSSLPGYTHWLVRYKYRPAKVIILGRHWIQTEDCEISVFHALILLHASNWRLQSCFAEASFTYGPFFTDWGRFVMVRFRHRRGPL